MCVIVTDPRAKGVACHTVPHGAEGHGTGPHGIGPKGTEPRGTEGHVIWPHDTRDRATWDSGTEGHGHMGPSHTEQTDMVGSASCSGARGTGRKCWQMLLFVCVCVSPAPK